MREMAVAAYGFGELPPAARRRAADKAREEYAATIAGEEAARALKEALPHSAVALFDDARLCGSLDVADACSLANAAPVDGAFDLSRALDGAGNWSDAAFERAFARTLQEAGLGGASAARTAVTVRRALGDLRARTWEAVEDCAAWFDGEDAHEGRLYTAAGDPIAQ